MAFFVSASTQSHLWRMESFYFPELLKSTVNGLGNHEHQGIFSEGAKFLQDKKKKSGVLQGNCNTHFLSHKLIYTLSFTFALVWFFLSLSQYFIAVFTNGELSCFSSILTLCNLPTLCEGFLLLLFLFGIYHSSFTRDKK